jgi:hypothetical protein
MYRLSAFITGAAIGVLGGLIGLGGAEFRLPVLITLFRFAALEAVILNRAMSLAVVLAALPFRSADVPMGEVLGAWPIIVNLLAGSLLGAWSGAGWALRLRADLMHKVIASLLVVIAAALPVSHGASGGAALLSNGPLALAGLIAGYAIGVVASLLGVAGGELLIPTLVLLFGVDIKLAGSLSLAISLPTMLVGLARHSSDPSFAAVLRNAGFVVVMVAGSILGAFLGGRLLGVVSGELLIPLLSGILLISAWKIWRQ